MKLGDANMGRKPADVGWSESEEELPDLEEDDEATKGVKKKLKDLKDELAKTQAEIDTSRGRDGEKKKPSPKAGDRKDRRKEGDVEKGTPAKKRRVGNVDDDRRYGRPQKPDPLWFGRRRREPSSGESKASESEDPSEGEKKDDSKRKKKDKDGGRSSKKKKARSDTGPFGVGKKVRYDGQSGDEDSSHDDDGETGFRAGLPARAANWL